MKNKILERKLIKAIKRGVAKGILGVIGDDNYKMKDCPFHLPKENIKFFTDMQRHAEQDPYVDFFSYPNAYNPKTYLKHND